MAAIEENRWEKHKKALRISYLDENLSLKEVQARMEAIYDFKAT